MWSEKTKVLVLGMDGLDPDIMEAMMKEGMLPAFQRLRDQGVFKRLATVIPPESPVVWSTLATGTNPGHHGIFDFIRRDPSNYSLDTSIATPKPNGGYTNLRRGETFWGKLSSRGIPVSVLFYPCEFPPSPVHGIVLSGMGVPDLQGTMGRYTLISTDPGWAEKDLRGSLIGVAFDRDTTKFQLPGMQIGGSPKNKVISISVKLRHHEQSDRISVELGGRKFDLAVGQWSPWVQVNFTVGFLRKVSGICRFYLTSTRPELNLYCTPIQFDPGNPVFDISSPRGFTETLSKELGPFATLGIPEDTKAYEDGVLDDRAFFGMVETILDERLRILEHMMSQWEKGLLFFYLGASDSVQHVFWADLLKDRLQAHGAKSLPAGIAEIYRRMDAILARVLERLKDEPETQLMVLSDHGFGDFRRSLHMNRLLADLGYLSLVGEAPSGGLFFKDVDWSKTKAYACGFSGIYLNRQGREAQGTVPPDQGESVLDSLKKSLLEYVDPETGEKPILTVHLGRDIYSGGHVEEGPDLVVGCRPGYRFSWQTALGATPSETIVKNPKKWRGDHIFSASAVPGVLFVRRLRSGIPSDITSVHRFILSHFAEESVSQDTERPETVR